MTQRTCPPQPPCMTPGLHWQLSPVAEYSKRPTISPNNQRISKTTPRCPQQTFLQPKQLTHVPNDLLGAQTTNPQPKCHPDDSPSPQTTFLWSKRLILSANNPYTPSASSSPPFSLRHDTNNTTRHLDVPTPLSLQLLPHWRTNMTMFAPPRHLLADCKVMTARPSLIHLPPVTDTHVTVVRPHCRCSHHHLSHEP